jgi:hypothetical protein
MGERAHRIGLERLAYRPHEVELIILAPEQGAFAKLSERCRQWDRGLPSMVASSARMRDREARRVSRQRFEARS